MLGKGKNGVTGEGYPISPVIYIALPAYPFMACAGLAAACLFLRRRYGRQHIGFHLAAGYLLAGTVCSFLGARILFVVGMIPSMEKITASVLLHYLFNGGIVFYGGLFGLIGGIVLASMKNHVNAIAVLDAICPAFPLFHAFARLGCLFAGCCYGVEWSWGITLAGEQGIVRFPVQLAESICDLGIFFWLLAGECKRRSRKGNLRRYLLSYAVCRFLLEFYRGDAVRGIWPGGFSTAQYISAGILLFFAAGVFGRAAGGRFFRGGEK